MPCNRVGESCAVSVVLRVGGIGRADNVFANYMRQSILKKELILVCGELEEDYNKWVCLSHAYPMVRVYRADCGRSHGECLNYCVDRAIFDYIAVFEEMHQYGSEYLAHSMDEINKHACCLTGKKTYLAEDENSRRTIVDPDFEHRFTDSVILPTFFFKRSLFDSTRFADGPGNPGDRYCRECAAGGRRIYSSGTADFLFLSSNG